jgi:hypothetical protein
MLSSEFPVIEVCPNCGSSHPHDGPCPALQGGVAQMYATPAAEIRFDPRQEYAGKVLQNR